MSRDWAAYFREYRAQREEAEAAGAAIDDEPPVLVSDEADVAVTGAAAKLLARVEDAGWVTRTRRAVVSHPAVLYKTGENRGRVRTEPKTVAHLFLTARHPVAQLRLGFQAEWVEGVRVAVERPKRPLKSKIPKRLLDMEAAPADQAFEIRAEGPEWHHDAPTLPYQGARVWDPIGKPVELFVDYLPNAEAMKRRKDEPEWAWFARTQRLQANGAQAEADYNDGADYIIREYPIKQAKEFDLWLEESLAIAPAQRKEAA